MDYDVIVVGARVAGATTAMLLARRGLRVLVVDRVAFPSDTISSHQIQVPGVARLRRWGLLEAVRAAGTPPTRRLRFDAGEVVLDGSFPPFEGADALYSPRRTLLDAALVDAARSAGADVRENFRVEELVWSEGRVVGVRGRERLGSSVALRARIVVGADGKNSFVASAVGARTYRQRPVRAFACYTYFSGLPVTAGEVYRRRGRLVAVFPTNDDLTMVYLSEPLSGFEVFRRDIEKHYLAALDGCGDLGGRAREARREERLRTTPDQPNRFRLPHGPGWALVGDAGVVMDSVSAQGITNALRDADLLAEALSAELDGVPSLAAYHRGATAPSGRCTTTPSGWPGTRPASPNGCCTPQSPTVPPRSRASSVSSRAPSRPTPISTPRPCCESSAPPGGQEALAAPGPRGVGGRVVTGRCGQ
ncbi:NAD(P)/FAD-dependent oxidoreductase [Actinomadura luteofluorescens]|uniref:NAD(P)/FAD-dependent oxidoreductase n=1 Tax=Actinomadura luteofluorescens TaxID=46163 RepID=UPI003628F4D9